MRNHSTSTTVRYHLGALWRLLKLWVGDFRVSIQDWTERNVAAPEPVYAKPELRVTVPATVMRWADGAGAICEDGERAEFWVMGRDDAAAVDAYLSRIGIRWTEEVAS